MATAIINSKFQIVDIRPTPRGIGDEVELTSEQYQALLAAGDLNTPAGYPRFMIDSVKNTIVEVPEAV